MDWQVAFPVVYLVTVYFMTEQPAEWGRLLMILAVSIANSLVAQAVGLLVGAAADVQVSRTFFFLVLQRNSLPVVNGVTGCHRVRTAWKGFFRRI